MTEIVSDEHGLERHRMGGDRDVELFDSETLLLEIGLIRSNALPASMPRFHGRISTMKSTIDAAGRLVIPKPIRAQLGWTGGEVLEIRPRNGGLEIEVAATEMELRETPLGWSAVPKEEIPPLTDDLVRETIEKTRR